MPHATHAAAVAQETEDRIADLLRERYREEHGPQGAAWNATLETLLSHRTVRAYLPDPVPAEALEVAVAAAQSAPSSSNLQAWNVIAVEDPALRARLNALAGEQRHVAGAPLLLVWLADLSRLRGIAAGRGHPSAGLDYLESLVIGVVDAALAAQNALVAFESLGLGACYIGAIRNHPVEVAALLGLPGEVLPVFGMTVGFPDPARPAAVKPRLARRAVLHRERYRPTQAGELARYDGIIRGFQAEQSLPAVDWSELASQRVATPEALKNRDKLREALLQLGFRLR